MYKSMLAKMYIQSDNWKWPQQSKCIKKSVEIVYPLQGAVYIHAGRTYSEVISTVVLLTLNDRLYRHLLIYTENS